MTEVQHGLDNIRARVDETQTKLQTLAREIEGDLNNLTARVVYLQGVQLTLFELLNLYQNHQHACVLTLERANEFIMGLHTLLEGLVPVNEVEKVLTYIERKVLLDMTDLRLVHRNPSFYYQVHSTAFTRSEHYVIIMLSVPLRTVGGLLGVYRVDRTHIPTRESDVSSTRLDNLPDFFAVTPDLLYYTEMNVADYITCRGEGIKVCSLERALRDASHLSCAAAVFYDNKQEVLKRCDISYESRHVPTTAIRIRENEYLIHSENSAGKGAAAAGRGEQTWSLHCPYAQYVMGGTGQERNTVSSVPSCNTCLVQIPCGCSPDGGSFYIPLQITGCLTLDNPGLPEVIKQFPVNLPLLTSMYDPASIENIIGNTSYKNVGNLLADVNFNVSREMWDEVVEKDTRPSATCPT